MKVMIIPEDPTLDRYILQPIVQHIFEDLGRKADVEVFQGSKVRGIDKALDPEFVADIIRDRGGMFNLFLLLVDRDCNDGRKPGRNNVETARQREAENEGRLLACLAVEEVEVWMLALHRDELDARWSDVRQDCHPKESYAEPLLKKKRWLSTLGRGRKKAMEGLGSKWQGLLQVCPELAEFKQHIATWLETWGEQVAR
ncbi:MAG: hypothetical protein ACXU86_00335 [Archangium sp.]